MEGKKKGMGKTEGGGERKTMHSTITDTRFSKQQIDPRFQRVPMKKRRVVVDSRFSAMLDEGGTFARKAVSDKYGRKVKHEIKEDLSRFYEMDEDGKEEGVDMRPSGFKEKKSGKGKKVVEEGENEDDSGIEAEDPGAKVNRAEGKKKVAKTKESRESEAESESEAEPSGKKGKKNKAEKVRKARALEVTGGMTTADKISKDLQKQDLRTAMMNWASSSSDDENSLDEEGYAEEDRLIAEAIDVSAPLQPVNGHVEAGEETKRLALVNIDWERVRAIDLLMLLRSFAPSNGQVLSVHIYVSRFGKERMEHERRMGPGAFLGAEKQRDEDGDQDEDDGGEVDMIKLRKYEAEKLRYYYAIAECDTVRTAMAIYEQCDGVEYEASSNVLDLRYVPDEEMFDEKPHSEAHGEAPPDYLSPFFTNKALGHTKVELTWDRDDPERDVLKGKGIAGKKKKKQREAELEAIDYSAFVGSSDSELSEDEDDHKAAKARALLLNGGLQDAFGNKNSKLRGGDDQEEGDMQITFMPGLNALGDSLLKRKKEREVEEGLSVWEKYQKKKADRKAEVRKKNKNGDQEDKDELPSDAERVDDSYFDDDPFFRLPDEEGEEGEGGPEGKKVDGIWKKKKAGKEALAVEERRKKEEARAEKERKEQELESLKKLMDDGTGKKEKKGYEIKHAALGRASERAGHELKGVKGKKKRDREAAAEDEGEDTFKLDLEDSRFSSIYTNPKFALDPTDPNFRKTPGLSKLLEQGSKKRISASVQVASNNAAEVGGMGEGKAEAKKKRDPALASLVSSLKGRKWAMEGKH